MQLRVLSWNLAYGKPASFKSIANRRRQWALIGAIRPNVALLQECRPTDIVDHAPGWLAQYYDIVGAFAAPMRLRTTLLVQRELEVRELDPIELTDAGQRWNRRLHGMVACGTVTTGETELCLVSVHALAQRVPIDDLVTEPEHQSMRRSAHDAAIFSDLVCATFEPWVANRRFIVGGDWNDSPLFDQIYSQGAYGGAGGSREFFARRSAAGWYDAMRSAHESDVRTYLDPRSAPYELDRLFTDARTFGAISNAVVLSGPLEELSDHAPVVVEFDL